MPKKILTPDEFNSLYLPIKFDPKIYEACRYVFVNGYTCRKAASTCGLGITIETEELFAAIQIINKYII